MNRYMHRLMVPFWFPAENIRTITDSQTVGTINLNWLAETAEQKQWILANAKVLRINGESLERLAAMYTLKEFLAKLQYSGLPAMVKQLRDLAKANV